MIGGAGTFYWKRRLADPTVVSDAEPCFLPVRVTPPAPVEVVLPNGTTLRLSPGCDFAFVRRVIDALAGASC